jgi:hypothetical protein
MCVMEGLNTWRKKRDQLTGGLAEDWSIEHLGLIDGLETVGMLTRSEFD